jgi:predicted aspartyl protease
LQTTLSNHYKVTANINGKNGSFIIDTGASSSCIDMLHIAHFKLTVKDTKMQATGAGASNIAMQVSSHNILRFGHWSKANVQIIVMDLSHVNKGLGEIEEAPVHGIIGADLLKMSRTVIDYGRNCMYVK